ncbi:MAG TPA: PAS domain S-box protein [Chthoniobacterales bacterium]|nr:PAS domain S-box protein [Chthoniobacterales bacterium]
MEREQTGISYTDIPTDRVGELNRAILESALDCIITMDAEGIVREFNPAAERVFGYRRDEAVGQELASLIIPPSLRERHRQGLAHYRKTGEGPVLGRRIEIAAVRADGVEILVELAITPLRIAGGPLFTAYLRDITERVRTERRRTAQYGVASLLAGSLALREVGPQVIQTIAASGDWVFGAIWIKREADAAVNCAATWHGEAAELDEFDKVTRSTELMPSSGLPGRVVAAEQAAWVPDVANDPQFVRVDAARRANLHGAFAFPLSGENGVVGVLELFSHSVVHPDEDLLKLVEALGSQIGLFIHRRRIQKELERQKEAAEAANAAKDRFLATLSHELRTPLTPVLIWAGAMAQDPAVGAETREGLQMVCRNVELEARLIDDLLDLTRITRGKLQLNLRTADGHDLLRHALEIVRSDIESRNLQLNLALEATSYKLKVDPPRIQQVFWNVLRNAAKFTQAGGSVSVRTFNASPTTFHVEISDTGIGIEPQHLDRIFEPFEQVSSRGEGLGLGLAISKAVVEMHGGSIRASSAGPGAGATFALELATSV